MQPHLPVASQEHPAGLFLILAPSQPLHASYLGEEIDRLQNCAKMVHDLGLVLFKAPRSEEEKGLLEKTMSFMRTFNGALSCNSDPSIPFIVATSWAARKFGELSLQFSHNPSVATPNQDPFLKALDDQCVKIYKKIQCLAENLCRNPNDETCFKLKLKIAMAEGIQTQLISKTETIRHAYLQSNITFAKNLLDRIEKEIKWKAAVQDPTVWLSGTPNPSSSPFINMHDALYQRIRAFENLPCCETYQNLQQVHTHAKELATANLRVYIPTYDIASLTATLAKAEKALKENHRFAPQELSPQELDNL